jgi:hypothetical protein
MPLFYYIHGLSDKIMKIYGIVAVVRQLGYKFGCLSELNPVRRLRWQSLPHNLG